VRDFPDLSATISQHRRRRILAAPEDNAERRGRVATRIINSAQRMERMIADLLDLTRTRLGGSMPLRRRPISLRQVCEDAIGEIRAGHPGAVLRVLVTEDLRGEWDSDRLTQVVANLVGNAIQHGNGSAITLIGQEHGDSVTLAVHNGGAPIPSEVLPFVFEPLAAAAPRRVYRTASAWACSSPAQSCRHMAATSRRVRPSRRGRRSPCDCHALNRICSNVTRCAAPSL